MILCERSESVGGAGVRLECAKMKDDEPFATFGAGLEKVALPGGKSSLVLGEKFDLIQVLGQHADKIVEILQAKFSDKGATHGELKKAFIVETSASDSTFARAWRDLKETPRVRIDKDCRTNRIYATK